VVRLMRTVGKQSSHILGIECRPMRDVLGWHPDRRELGKKVKLRHSHGAACKPEVGDPVDGLKDHWAAGRQATHRRPYFAPGARNWFCLIVTIQPKECDKPFKSRGGLVCASACLHRVVLEAHFHFNRAGPFGRHVLRDE